ncbi:hypothetical protein Tco_0285977 [Tanacetum coccineum]
MGRGSDEGMDMEGMMECEGEEGGDESDRGGGCGIFLELVKNLGGGVSSSGRDGGMGDVVLRESTSERDGAGRGEGSSREGGVGRRLGGRVRGEFVLRRLGRLAREGEVEDGVFVSWAEEKVVGGEGRVRRWGDLLVGNVGRGVYREWRKSRNREEGGDVGVGLEGGGKRRGGIFLGKGKAGFEISGVVGLGGGLGGVDAGMVGGLEYEWMGRFWGWSLRVGMGEERVTGRRRCGSREKGRVEGSEMGVRMGSMGGKKCKVRGRCEGEEKRSGRKGTRGGRDDGGEFGVEGGWVGYRDSQGSGVEPVRGVGEWSLCGRRRGGVGMGKKMADGFGSEWAYGGRGGLCREVVWVGGVERRGGGRRGGACPSKEHSMAQGMAHGMVLVKDHIKVLIVAWFWIRDNRNLRWTIVTIISTFPTRLTSTSLTKDIVRRITILVTTMIVNVWRTS